MAGSAPTIRLALACLAALAAQAETHFHHLHLNSADPAAAAAFYPARFAAERLPFEGQDSVFAQKSWLLFRRVAKPPPAAITSAIWHFGWGAEDMKAEYERQLKLGTRFDTPITEMVPGFFYSYVAGPDGALIEINTAKHRNFGHLHLLSKDPVAAGEWYVKHLGARYASGRPPSREPRFLNGFQIGPMASLMIDNVNLIIFPVEYARQQWPELWKNREQFDSPKGRVIDHIAFSADRIADAIVRLREAGVRVIDEPPELQRSAMIEGPDRIRIELLEGHSPTAWGSDHAGKQIPEFVHGEECLFCHRASVGVTWQQNAHARSVRPKEGMFELGNRVLKPSGYGKLAIQEKDGAWNETKFADRCAGCHATAVNSSDLTFAYTGIDCFSCHGNVDLNHSGNPSLVLLSKKRRDTPLLVTSVCAQCHLRGGESRSTKLPYPNQFVPGDNLLLDFAANWRRADDAALNPGDRHVWRSARDVALNRSETTCLSCHSVHGNSTQRHRRVLAGPICNDCHFPGRPRKQVRRYEVRSPLCEY